MTKKEPTPEQAQKLFQILRILSLIISAVSFVSSIFCYYAFTVKKPGFNIIMDNSTIYVQDMVSFISSIFHFLIFMIVGNLYHNICTYEYNQSKGLEKKELADIITLSKWSLVLFISKLFFVHMLDIRYILMQKHIQKIEHPSWAIMFKIDYFITFYLVILLVLLYSSLVHCYMSMRITIKDNKQNVLIL